ncbi:hypothetical protein TNCV_1882601 [Trichonephila clavipes]|nr:hypothetical protein TNCV_1882601 [Trichonephila clavipes]
MACITIINVTLQICQYLSGRKGPLRTSYASVKHLRGLLKDPDNEHTNASYAASNIHPVPRSTGVSEKW